jgi:hypothetical protein
MNNKFALQIYNPVGVTEISNLHAARLSNLNGKTIGELSDGVWQHDRTFTELRKTLLKRFPELKIIPYTEFPVGDEIDSAGIGQLVKSKGCDCVIVGNGA